MNWSQSETGIKWREKRGAFYHFRAYLFGDVGMQQDLTRLSPRELARLRDWCVKLGTLTLLSHQDRPLVSQSSPSIHTSQCFCEEHFFLFIIQHKFSHFSKMEQTGAVLLQHV